MLPTWSPLKLQKVCSGNLLCLPREFGCHGSGRWGAICSHLCNTTKQQRAKCVLSHSGRHACYFTLGSKPGVLKPVGASIRVGHMGLNTDAAEWLFPCWCIIKKLLYPGSEFSQVISSGFVWKESTKKEKRTMTVSVTLGERRVKGSGLVIHEMSRGASRVSKQSTLSGGLLVKTFI